MQRNEKEQKNMRQRKEFASWALIKNNSYCLLFSSEKKISNETLLP